MAELLTCAKCGQRKELTNSPISDGIKQPRICKECMIQGMRTDDWATNDGYWLKQLAEAGEKASFNKVIKDLDAEMKAKLQALYKVWSTKDAKATEAQAT